MTVAVERPTQRAEAEAAEPEEPFGLLDLAESVYQRLPGYRPEIIEGRLTVNPPPDIRHAKSLSRLQTALGVLAQHGVDVVQGVGLWLPTGDDDYVIPDLAVVDTDAEEHVVAFNCCDPRVFRLVVEVTSVNWRTDVNAKPAVYAAANVPVYLIVDREHREVVVLSDPRTAEYRVRAVYKPGETFTLPEAVGAAVELETDALLGDG